MIIQDYHIAYFVGIGGIGMSALARWFKMNGFEVFGYDKTSTVLTDSLIDEGIAIHFEDSLDLIPKEVMDQQRKTLVIYTPAVPDSHCELNYLRDNGYDVIKRSEALGMITASQFTIAVAGTHGKTTTSTMLAHILKSSGYSMAAFLGGISSNYNSNLIINGEQNERTIAVVEADEYDRSFLRLHPNVAIITSMDADHLDIYGAPDELKKSFNDFAGLVPQQGKLILHNKLLADLPGDRSITYGLEEGDASIISKDIDRGSTSAKMDYNGHSYTLILPMPGDHNLLNAMAASLAAIEVGVTDDQLQNSIESFRGVKRRFEFIIRENDLVFIDDYAHHPEEIKAIISATRMLYPERRISVVFQPHLFSRTRDFAEGFRKSLSLADDLILLEIYAAREEPIDGVTSTALAEGLKNVKVTTREELVGIVEMMDIEVLLTLGAGDIDTCVEPLKELLKTKYLSNEAEV